METMSLNQLFTACYVRDNHTCQDCGATEKLETHHILPISQGGKNTLENLKTVCYDCHRANYKDVHYPKDKSKIIPHNLREKSRTGTDLTKVTPILLSFSPELTDKVDDYRFENRIKSRTQTILELVKKGLEKEPTE